jgi:hypothetical protein
MSKISDYFKVSLDPQSPAMPVRIITGLVVSVLGFLWLPFGMLGLLILFWIVYVTKPPEISALSGAERTDIFVPMDGLVTSIETLSGKKIIRIAQQIHSNKLILMPCHGKIDINMFIDGLFLPADILNASNLNARREISVIQDDITDVANTQNTISLIIWGRPFARYLASPISEGRVIEAGIPIAISLLHGDLDIIVPSNYEIMVNLGEFCIAGKTVLARQL